MAKEDKENFGYRVSSSFAPKNFDEFRPMRREHTSTNIDLALKSQILGEIRYGQACILFFLFAIIVGFPHVLSKETRRHPRTNPIWINNALKEGEQQRTEESDLQPNLLPFVSKDRKTSLDLGDIEYPALEQVVRNVSHKEDPDPWCWVPPSASNRVGGSTVKTRKQILEVDSPKAREASGYELGSLGATCEDGEVCSEPLDATSISSTSSPEVARDFWILVPGEAARKIVEQFPLLAAVIVAHPDKANLRSIDLRPQLDLGVCDPSKHKTFLDCGAKWSRPFAGGVANAHFLRVLKSSEAKSRKNLSSSVNSLRSRVNRHTSGLHCPSSRRDASRKLPPVRVHLRGSSFDLFTTDDSFAYARDTVLEGRKKEGEYPSPPVRTHSR
ncbi:hypothetical protein SCHPADRAFT_886701 [Schizopora paradoxa]|uniref:Transmembrane protein n=1 Tax=Schizopora paradoxa TaxID=27342 RepID=A0A0H2S1Z6_9AGAM|nr:hypothetical protein SCHPADRAFT_886701 [Schizopora paradoxa]